MKQFDEARKGTGAQEWCDRSYNICRGCEHGCLYCYAKSRACRYDATLRGPGQWNLQALNPNRSRRGAEIRNAGVVMFPTSHDITPKFLPEALATIQNLLATNQVLVVSNPHLSVVRELCRALADSKRRLLFRFTISSLDPQLCAFWEPGAPGPAERIEALKHAFALGFKTSVSIEPMLDSWQRTVDLVAAVQSQVTDSIWIGKMRNIPRKLNSHVNGLDEAIARIKSQQSDEHVLNLVGAVKNNSKVRWKDSIRLVVANSGAGRKLT